MIEKCPYCKSIWVCWNWINAWGGDFEKYKDMNPHIPEEKLRKTMWTHECWRCNGCFETGNQVHNGIPYWILKLYGFIKYRIFKIDD